jgi:transposase-like protein
MLEKKSGGGVSAGYPAIEKLIDSENFNQINAVFEKAYNELSEQAKVKRGLKKSREAKKAIHAIELIMSLFKELLEIKYKIQSLLKRGEAKKV